MCTSREKFATVVVSAKFSSTFKKDKGIERVAEETIDFLHRLYFLEKNDG